MWPCWLLAHGRGRTSRYAVINRRSGQTSIKTMAWSKMSVELMLIATAVELVSGQVMENVNRDPESETQGVRASRHDLFDPELDRSSSVQCHAYHPYTLI
jgi:hypothetical protein